MSNGFYITFGDIANARANAETANELDRKPLILATPTVTPGNPSFQIPEIPTIRTPKRPVESVELMRLRLTVYAFMQHGIRVLTETPKIDTYKYSEAIDFFTQVIDLDRNYAPAYYSRGLAYTKQNNLKSAIEDFSEAIRLNPEFSLAYSSRASAHQANGEIDQALKDYDRALTTDPTLASANLGRGLILLKQQQWKPAAEAFTQTLEADPEMLEALEGRSIARKNLNDLPGSLNDQSRAKRLRDR